MFKVTLFIVVYLCAVRAQHSAICKISEDSGSPDEDIHGTITLDQDLTSGRVTIKADLRGFNETDDILEHGFHIHTEGDLSDECRAAGGHYNPHGADHGAPSDSNRHVGDLGNIMESAGAVKTTIEDDSGLIQLDPTHENTVIGRAMVVHQHKDDLGRGGDEGSMKTGNAGGRMACCIIEEVEPPVSSSFFWSSNTLIILGIATLSWIYLCF